jgi:hypothetical protein
VAAFFWCVDRKKGFVLALTALAAGWFVFMLKGVIGLPRPYFLDPALGLAKEFGNGCPSGHAAMSMFVWGLIACAAKKKPLRIGAIVFIIVIALTRLYLGVHFYWDILAGWLLGAAFIAVFLLILRKSKAYHAKNADGSAAPTYFSTRRLLVIGLALLSFILTAAYPGKKGTMLAGLFFGVSMGYLVSITKLVDAEAVRVGVKSLVAAVVKMLIGLAGTGVVYYCLHNGLQILGPAWREFARFVTYAGCGFWMGFVHYVFQALRLNKTLDFSNFIAL